MNQNLSRSYGVLFWSQNMTEVDDISCKQSNKGEKKKKQSKNEHGHRVVHKKHLEINTAGETKLNWLTAVQISKASSVKTGVNQSTEL